MTHYRAPEHLSLSVRPTIHSRRVQLEAREAFGNPGCGTLFRGRGNTVGSGLLGANVTNHFRKRVHRGVGSTPNDGVTIEARVFRFLPRNIQLQIRNTGAVVWVTLRDTVGPFYQITHSIGSPIYGILRAGTPETMG